MNKNNQETMQLLKRLPKKYHKMLDYIERESGLIDDCKFMIYLKDGYNFGGYDGGTTFPAKSITECITLIRDLATKDGE